MSTTEQATPLPEYEQEALHWLESTDDGGADGPLRQLRR